MFVDFFSGMMTHHKFLRFRSFILNFVFFWQGLAAPGLALSDGLAPRDNPPTGTNHGANCVKTKPGMCTISADFMTDIAGTGADNMFMVFDENCKLDINSPKTLDPCIQRCAHRYANAITICDYRFY